LTAPPVSEVDGSPLPFGQPVDGLCDRQLASYLLLLLILTRFRRLRKHIVRSLVLMTWTSVKSCGEMGDYGTGVCGSCVRRYVLPSAVQDHERILREVFGSAPVFEQYSGNSPEMFSIIKRELLE
jgi:hypothetical protein